MPVLVQPPFNYTGSKYRLLPQLMPLFDYSRPALVDLCAGGGSVWCNLVPYFEHVIANDIIRDLIGAQQALMDGDAIACETRALCVAKEDKAGYHRLRDNYNATPSAAKYFALTLCCNNNMARFNASFRFNQTFGRRTWNSSTTEKVSRYTAHIRPYRSRVHFLPSDFARVAIPHSSMVYVDPPYSNSPRNTGSRPSGIWRGKSRAPSWPCLRISRRPSSKRLIGLPSKEPARTLAAIMRSS